MGKRININFTMYVLTLQFLNSGQQLLFACIITTQSDIRVIRIEENDWQRQSVLVLVHHSKAFHEQYCVCILVCYKRVCSLTDTYCTAVLFHLLSKMHLCQCLSFLCSLLWNIVQDLLQIFQKVSPLVLHLEVTHVLVVATGHNGNQNLDIRDLRQNFFFYLQFTRNLLGKLKLLQFVMMLYR